MTQEDKDLLLKDLCARLPYGVKCSFGVDNAIYEICGINPICCGASEIQATHIKSGINGDFTLNACKPYLFPLSSMTEEQKEERKDLLEDKYGFDANGNVFTLQDFYNKYHLDYRGLIPMGLAIDCTNLNIY
jgi:hypothetical protein